MRNYNVAVLTNEDDISYYLLGAFISDGNVSIAHNKYYTSSIGSVDKEWIESIRDSFDKNFPITKVNNFYSLRLYNTKIGQWFISKGCIPNKSLCVTMPNIPDQYLPDFIRGIFDGDGCLTFNKKHRKTINFKSYICGSSIELLKSLQSILKNKGIAGIIRNKKENREHKIKNKTIITFNQHWRLEFSKLPTLKLLEFMYYDTHKLSLKRKYESFVTIKNIYLEDKTKNFMLNTHLKIEWPSDEDLIELINNNTYMSVSRLLGVSNTAIVAYMKNRGIYIPKGSGKGNKNIIIQIPLV